MPQQTVVPIIATREPVHDLTADECRNLRTLVGDLLPGDIDYTLPGADDEHIFATILTEPGTEWPLVRAALKRLDELGKGAFAELSPAQRAPLLQSLHDAQSSLFMAVLGIAVRCYYRDDRVMRSLGMAIRPPFPQGFEVESGDWSLLDEVAARSPLYRDVTP